MSWRHRFAKTILGLCLLISTATAQPKIEIKYRLNGPAGSHFGWSVSKIGNVDGDHEPDIIIGAPQTSPNGKTAAGSIFIYSGKTGKLILRKNGANAADRFGQILCGFADLNGDKKGDFAVGLPEADPDGKIQAGSVLVFSGTNGRLLYQVNGRAPFELFGQTLCNAGDVNRDGHEDFAGGAPNASSVANAATGAIRVFSGQDGRLIFEVPGQQPGELLSVCAAAGDVNGDGFADLLIGHPNADWNGIKQAGIVQIFSGALNGANRLLFELGGNKERQNFGQYLAGAGDINGDKKSDFIVGAPIDCHNGEAFVYSGGTKSLLFHLSHPPGQFCHFGETVARAGDLDGDGIQDLVVGSATDSPDGKSLAGHLKLFSGASAKELFDLKGAEPQSRLGFSVAALGDIDGDGAFEFAVGVPYATSTKGPQGGQVLIFTSQPKTRSKTTEK